MYSFFFFNDTATTEIYTLSLHGALPILPIRQGEAVEAQHLLGAGDAMDAFAPALQRIDIAREHPGPRRRRSEEHTSELQSHSDLVCRLLLEKKKCPVPRGSKRNRSFASG